jgi:glycosyltransferase involved in cell wall biosynthesis
VMPYGSKRRPLRVVTMVDRLMTSGGEIVATRVAMNLDRERFESILCSTRTSEVADIKRAEAAGIRVLTLNRRSRLDVVKWHPLFELLRRERVDILHAHKFGSNAWAALLGRLARVPVIVAHEHTWSYSGQPLRRLIDRELIGRSAAAFLAVSPEDRRRMIEVEGVDSTKVRYVPNGVPALAAGDGTPLRRSLGASPTTPVVGTVCALRPQKGVDVLLAAVAALVVEVPDLRVVIVGDGPERTRLKRLSEEMGLVSTVEFLGSRTQEELPDILSAIDVMVSSSTFEGMPLAIIEWMAAGKAIVATKVGGVPALVEDGVHGLLVEPGDPNQLAGAIAKLLRDADLRSALGASAAYRQRRTFDLHHMVRSLESLYEALYWSSPRGRREALRSIGEIEP